MKALLFSLFALSRLVLNEPIETDLSETPTESVEETTLESAESVENVQESSENDEKVEEKTYTEEEFKQALESYLSKYLEESLVHKIIQWMIDAGVLAALFGVYVKYRKYKHNSLEDVVKAFKTEVMKYIDENLSKLTNEQVESIKEVINDLSKSNETIMKVLVLMQDKTPEGKVALLDYLGSKTNSEEVKKQAIEVKEKVEIEKKAEEEVKEAVKEDYKDIF